MPNYQITAPDGRKLRITAPEGATQEQVLAYAQQQYGKQQAAPEKTMSERYAAAGIDPTPVDPTSGMSGTDKFLAGAGKSVMDTVQGVGQLFGAVPQSAVDERRRLDAPLMATGAGMAGNVAGQAAQIAVPVPAGIAAKGASMLGRAAPYVAAAGRAGAFSATQGVGTGESRAGNAAQGAAFGVAGQGIASGAARLGKGMADKIAPEVMDLYQKAQAAGIPVHFSQLSDSKFVKTLASTLGYLPFTGAGGKAAAQQAAFNKAAGRSFGENAASLTDDVLSQAKQRIGGEFQRIYGQNNVSIDTQTAAKLIKVRSDAMRNLPPQEAQVVANQIDDIIQAAPNGEMPGLAYQAFRTDRLLPGEGGNSFQGQAFRTIRKIMDDAADKSVGPQDAAALAKARGQYRNLKTVEKSLKQVSGSQGNVKPASLWPIVNQSRGSTKELRELAKVGQLLKDPIPDSGTAGRLLATGGLGTAGLTGGMAAASPLAQLLLLGATVGRAANSESAAKYLTQGSKPIRGLARLLKSAPYLLPATAQAESGGR